MPKKLIDANRLIDVFDKNIVNDSIRNMVKQYVEMAPVVITDSDKALHKIVTALDNWAYDDPKGFVNYVNGLLAMCDWSVEE